MDPVQRNGARVAGDPVPPGHAQIYVIVFAAPQVGVKSTGGEQLGPVVKNRGVHADHVAIQQIGMRVGADRRVAWRVQRLESGVDPLVSAIDETGIGMIAEAAEIPFNGIRRQRVVCI